jgi:hypothetical protein
VNPKPVFIDGSIGDIFTGSNKYNLAIGLLRDTNDLYISTNTTTGTRTTEQGVLLPNVPTQTPFRIGVVIMDSAFEVYMNGKLFATKTFQHRPKATSTYFWGPPDRFRNTVRVMNFTYWDRPLMAMEVPKTPPAIPDASKFNPSGLPAASCS